MSDPLLLILSIVIVVISAAFHEAAHGFVAYRLGDPTAKECGRLTLNPLKHIDPQSSIIFPLLLAIMNFPIIAAAKPVPYNPQRLKNPRRDELLVALAGPFSNSILAVLGGLALFILNRIYPMLSTTNNLQMALISNAYNIVLLVISINISLCFFNLIPFPPLDGSKIILFCMRNPKQRAAYNSFSRYSIWVLILGVQLIAMFFKFDPLTWYYSHTTLPIFSFIVWAAM